MAGAFSPGSIGLIGSGLMGTAFAERLLAAGFHVIMWDGDASRMAPLSALGAESAANAVVVGARCACTILSLPNSDVVATVLAAMAETWREGGIIIDTSTGQPADAVRFHHSLAERGVTYLDATISGNSEQLRRGEALCMVGGDPEAFARCADLWAAFGDHAMHVGPSGDGARLKLVTNLVLGLNRAALAEGLVLAEAMGLDPARALEVLRASAAYSRVMDAKGEKMIGGDFTPVARLSQHLKDVRLMLEAAADADLPLPLSETHRQLLERAEAAGWGDLDNSAIIKVMRKSP